MGLPAEYNCAPVRQVVATLSAALGWSSKVPFMAELMDRGWNGDSDLDAMLANLKKAIET